MTKQTGRLGAIASAQIDQRGIRWHWAAMAWLCVAKMCASVRVG